jgi:hypothetical protein
VAFVRRDAEGAEDPQEDQDVVEAQALLDHSGQHDEGGDEPIQAPVRGDFFDCG